MNEWLRKLAIFIGLGLLIISIYWSQDGFNFSLAGSSSGGDFALYFGWFIAFAVCVIQFVFSTNYKELNPSLLLFGIMAYIYSMYTNYQGVIHFQGLQPSPLGAGILAIFMDAVPEPLIAWGLYESLQGDFIGNIIKLGKSKPNQPQNNNRQGSQQYQGLNSKPYNMNGQENRQQRHEEMRNKPKPNVPPFLLNKNREG